MAGPLTDADTLRVLAAIRTFHSPQDTGETAVSAWQMALGCAGITSLDDALLAVAQHYSTPGMDRWITPADVAAGVRKIRATRLASADSICPRVDPDEVSQWLAERRAGIRALGDGVVPPPAPVPPAIAPRLALALPGVFRRPPRVERLAVEGQATPPAKTHPAVAVTPEESARAERERARQLAALEALARSGELA